MKAKFITFEGGEGSGKSTQSKKLVEHLRARNIQVMHTREVGGTPEAEKIRDILVYSELEPLSELMLVMAARFEHLHKIIIPSLKKGVWVVCDRFVDSTAAYQSGVYGLTIPDIYDLHDKLMNVENKDIQILPDYTFFMDIPPKIGLNRAGIRGETNKFEDKNITFHEMVYENFKTILTMFPERFINIESVNKSEDEISDVIRGFLYAREK